MCIHFCLIFLIFLNSENSNIYTGAQWRWGKVALGPRHWGQVNFKKINIFKQFNIQKNSQYKNILNIFDFFEFQKFQNIQKI